MLSCFNISSNSSDTNMYKKLIKDLPFQPSLIGDIAIAARRARRDRILYGVSLVFLLLLIFLIVINHQHYASGETQYQSTQSLVPFGFADKQSAVDACGEDQSYYSSILHTININCAQLKQAEKTTYDNAMHRIDNQTNLTVVQRATPQNEQNNQYKLDMVNHPSIQLLQSDKKTLKQDGLSRVLVGSHDSGQTFIAFLSGEIIATTQSPQNLLRGHVMAAQTKPKSNKPNFCISEHEKQCLKKRHRVINETQSLASADKTSASPGDVLRYEFIIENRSDESHEIALENNSLSILEKALVLDINDGEINQNSTISWPAQTITAGDALMRSITVQIREGMNHLSNKTIDNHFGNTTSLSIRPSGIPSVLANTDMTPSMTSREVLIATSSLTGLVLLLFIYSHAKESELTALVNLHKRNGLIL